MIHIVTTHWKSPRFAQIQADFFRRFTNEPHRLYCFYGPQDGAPFKDYYFAAEGPPQYDPNEGESVKNNLLAEMIITDPETQDDDMLVFVHGDTLPVGDWSWPVRMNLPTRDLVAVRRTENHEVYPHPSFCATTVGFWKEIHGDWRRGEYTDLTGKRVSEIGGRLHQALKVAHVDWLPLERCNVTDLHSLFFGVYGVKPCSMGEHAIHAPIYHHAMGLRDVDGSRLGGQVSRIERAHPDRAAADRRLISRILNRLFPDAVRRALRRRAGESTRLSRAIAAIHPTIRWETAVVEAHAELSEKVYELIRTQPGKFINRCRNLTLADLEPRKPPTEPDGIWEVASDDDEVMHHVRWSIANDHGWFYVYHYPEKWRAESQARHLNEIGKRPWEFREWRP